SRPRWRSAASLPARFARRCSPPMKASEPPCAGRWQAWACVNQASSENADNSQMTDGKLALIPLGGATEIGKNMYVYRWNDQYLVVDCGLMFPNEEMLGVDILIPDVSFLLERKEQVQGIVLTHGHEDHIGALPYVLRQLPVPIYATRLTLGLIRAKLQEHGLWTETEWHLVEDADRVKIGLFEVEFVH